MQTEIEKWRIKSEKVRKIKTKYSQPGKHSQQERDDINSSWTNLKIETEK